MNLFSVANREAGLRSLAKLERAVDGFGYKRNIKTSFYSIVWRNLDLQNLYIAIDGNIIATINIQ